MPLSIVTKFHEDPIKIRDRISQIWSILDNQGASLLVILLGQDSMPLTQALITS